MKITWIETEYKTENYRIQVEIRGDKSEVAVFDKDNNLLISCLSLEQAKTIAHELLEVITLIK